MNEIKVIHLGRQPFTIAVDAHSDLRRYLDAIAKHASKDVVEEVEIRMAELLMERGFDDKKVVLKTDVDNLKENLGEPADFSDDSDAAAGKTETVPETENKRLFRDTSNGVLGGVAAGIAAYTGIPVWVTRLIFIGLTFAWGTSVLLYVLLWLILPDAKTPSDRLQMHGKPVTIETIKEFVDSEQVRENAKELGDKVGKVSAAAGNRIATGAVNASTAIGRGILSFIGIILIIAGLAGSLYVLGMGSYAIITPESLFDAGALFPVGTREISLLVLAMLLAIIIFIMMISAGVALVRRRWPLPIWLSAALLAVLLAGGAIAVPIAISVAPRISERYKAARTTTTLQLTEFTGIDIRGPETVVSYVPSTSYSIDVVTIGNINKDVVKPVIENGVLKLSTDGFRGSNGCTVFCIHTEDLQLVIHSPELLNVAVDEGAVFKIDAQITQIKPMIINNAAGTSLRLNYMNLKNVSLKTSNGDRTLILNGFQSATQEMTINDSDEWGYKIDQAQEFEFSGDQVCSSDEPMVYLNTQEPKLTINGKPYTEQALKAARSEDSGNDVNCIVIRDLFNIPEINTAPSAVPPAKP